MIFEKPGKETFQIFHFLVVFRVTNYSQKNSKIYQKTPLRRREANKKSMMMMIRGGFGGGGGRAGGGRLFPQGFDPLPTQRVPPWVLFRKSMFGDGP